MSKALTSILIAFCLTFFVSLTEAWAQRGPCDQLFASRQPVVEFEIADQDVSEVEMLARMEQNLPELYLGLRMHAITELRQGKQDFSYPIMKPVFQRVIEDLSSRIEREQDIPIQQSLIRVRASATELMKHELPYKAMVRFIFREYLPAMDDILLRNYPEYRDQNYHRGHAEHLLEKFLEEAPQLLLYFSFEPVTEKFFLQARAAPLFLVGLNLSGLDSNTEAPPFADGFHMKVSEFSWHDMGHIEFMYGRDLQYLKVTSKSMERITMEWESTKNRYIKFWDRHKSDQNLYDAMALLLFEIVHERGYQYSLTVLKKELETEKWLEVIRRKIANNYYDPLPFINRNAFPRLEEARQLLLKETKRLKREAQVQWFRTLQADRVISTFIYNAPLRYGVGNLHQIELVGTDASEIIVTALNSTSGVQEQTDIAHVILPQVHPPKVNPFGDDDHPSLLRDRIARVLTLVKRGLSKSILIKPDQSVFVNKINGELIPIEEFPIPTNTPRAEIENLRLFEIAQALGSEERATPIHYTIEEPQRVFKGVGRLIRDSNGNIRVQVREPFGPKKVLGDFSIEDLRIDSLNVVEI